MEDQEEPESEKKKPLPGAFPGLAWNSPEMVPGAAPPPGWTNPLTPESPPSAIPDPAEPPAAEPPEPMSYSGGAAATESPQPGRVPGMTAKPQAIDILDAVRSLEAWVPSEKNANGPEVGSAGSRVNDAPHGPTSLCPDAAELRGETQPPVESTRATRPALAPAPSVPEMEPMHPSVSRAGNFEGRYPLAFGLRLQSPAAHVVPAEPSAASAENRASVEPAGAVAVGGDQATRMAVSPQAPGSHVATPPAAQPPEERELRADPDRIAMPVPEARRPQAPSSREITSGHTAAAEGARHVPGAEQPAEPAARDIRLRVGGGEQRVDVRVTERGGEVQVAVRTPDSRLAVALRNDLPALSSRLEQAGFRAETWHPAAPLSEPHLAAARVSAEGSAPGHPGGGPRDGHEQHEPPARRQPAPESESGPDAFAKGFLWQLSSLR